jgi:predicted enzyme related to lactoylglutathione lyase
MLVRDRYPAGVPCWIDLLPPDPAAAAGFYGGLFGWTFEERIPAEVPGSYQIASLDGLVVAAIGSPPADGEPGADLVRSQPVRWNTYVSVDDADAAAARARDAGGTVLVEPYDVNVAGRAAAIADPSGAVVHVWQPGVRAGVQVANAPGSWNWSNLSTTEPAAAAEFYGRVFGWEARAIDLGGVEAMMLCLPGYGDFLASLEPGIRERQAAEGVPEGFADAIAWLQTADPGTAPEWTVTFAAADTEAAAAWAAEYGGTVLVPPFDAGDAQVATLVDPAGTVFTVNTWAPTEST